MDNTDKKVGVWFSVVGILIYGVSLFNGFVWDDFPALVDNTYVHSLGNIGKLFLGGSYLDAQGMPMGSYYRPMMSVVFALIYSVSSQAFFFHLAQLVLHVAVAVMVFFLFRKLLSTTAGVVSGLVFLVHPINSNSVLFISAMGETLYVFFGLLAWLWLPRVKTIWQTGWLALLLFLSLLSKESGALFFLMLTVYALLFEKTKLKFLMWAQVIAMGVYAFLRFEVAHLFFMKDPAISPLVMPLANRLLNTPKIILFYLKTFVDPCCLAISQYWLVKTANWVDFYGPMLVDTMFFAGIAGLGWLVLQKKRQLFRTYILFAIWLVAGLGLHSQVIPLDLTVSENWFYFPIIGLLGLGAVAFRLVSFSKKTREKGWVLAAIVLISLGVRTFVRGLNWKDMYTLYSHDIKISTESFDLENNLGIEMLKLNQWDEAIPHFQKSISLFPYRPGVWTNLGEIYRVKKEYATAEQYYKISLNEAKKRNVAGSFGAYAGLVEIYLFDRNDFQATREVALAGLRVYPTSSQLWLHLAGAEYKLGNQDKAIEAVAKSYELDPSETTLQVYRAILGK
jgi:protein O-mannosyl-transferase